MAEFLLSVWHDEDFDGPDEVDFTEEDMQRLHTQVGAFNEELQGSGAWVFAGGLMPGSSATVVKNTEIPASTPAVGDGSVGCAGGPRMM